MKAHSELNLAREMKGIKKGFYRCISCKRSMREYVNSLLNRAGELVTEDREKPEVLSAFLPFVFTGKTDLQQPQGPENRGNVRSEEDLTLVEEDQVREHLDKMYIHTCMDPE